MRKTISILGAGSWGLAIARLLAGNNHDVIIWEFDSKEYELLRKHRAHPKKLPQCQLDDSVIITNDLLVALENTDLVVLAIPAQFLRSVLNNVEGSLLKSVGIVNLAKGIETKTLKRMSEVIIEVLGCSPENVSTLSGPSHAEEVALDMPTTVVAAAESEDLVTSIQEIFSTQYFRVYNSSDLIGVELGGSLKNIIAIAAGIVAGLEMGDNTFGALLTRGLAEITRLGVTMGADPLTFAGLSGVGDLVTTCVSRHSRNRQVGERIGRGEKLEAILATMHMVAEGVETTRSGYELAQLHQVEMPITRQVHQVLFEQKSPSEAVGELMDRELKPEIWR